MWEQKKEDKPICVKNCGRASEEELVYIDYYVMVKINYLMKKYQNLEWLAYLIGKPGTDNVVEDFYIPKQQVTGSNVSDIEGDPNIQIIGVIHSHHHLGLHSFSGTDHAYINDNHDLSILVWHGGMNGQKRVKLPCGSTMIVPIRIEFFHPDLNETELEQEANENISEKKYVYTYPVTTVKYGGPGGTGVYDPTGNAEKKTKDYGSSCETKNENGNVATGKRDASFEDYLDKLVYDDEQFGEACAEDFPLSDEEVEAHFQRIESRECGIVPSGNGCYAFPRVPRHLDDGGNISKKSEIGPWEV